MVDEGLSWLDRLKRHYIGRVVIPYAIVIGFVMQIAARVFPYFGWSRAVPPLVIVLLASLPVVLVLTWLLARPRNGSGSSAWQHQHRKLGTTVSLLVVILVGISGFYAWRYSERHEQLLTAAVKPDGVSFAVSSAAPASAAVIPAKSIAVLSFVNMSGDPSNEYFSDGMSEELLNALTQVKDLKVAGRTSSFYFKGKNEDLRIIGKALGVANILEGSVRKQGNEVRITAQLIRVADDTHLWAHAYDGELSDVFQLQENIARAITEQLKVVLIGGQKERLVPVLTQNNQAHDLYLRATDALNKRDYSRMGQAIGWLEHAIALDPNFARAQARLALLHIAGKTQYGASTEEAKQHAQLAITLDPSLAEPHIVLGLIAFRDRHYLDAREAMDRAISLEPDDASVNLYIAENLINTGYTRLGIARLDRSLEVDPLLPNALFWRGLQYMAAGDLDAAERMLQQARELGLSFANLGLSQVARMRGDYAKSRVLALPLLLSSAACFKNPKLSIPIYLDGTTGGDASARAKTLALINECLAAKPAAIPVLAPVGLMRLEQPERALEVIARGPTADETGMFLYFWGPVGAGVRHSPQFAAFALKVGFAALWDKYGPPDDCAKNTAGDYVCTQ